MWREDQKRNEGTNIEFKEVKDVESTGRNTTFALAQVSDHPGQYKDQYKLTGLKKLKRVEFKAWQANWRQSQKSLSSKIRKLARGEYEVRGRKLGFILNR